jgi:hypothetical protein
VQIGDFKIINFGSGLPRKKSAPPDGDIHILKWQFHGYQNQFQSASALFSSATQATSPVG